MACSSTPGLVVRLGLAVAADPHRPGRDPLDAAVAVVEHLGPGEARVDLDAERLGLLAQPAHDPAHADDVVAGIVHLRRRRQADRARGGEPEEAVLGHGRGDGRAGVAPVRQQLVERARLQDRARERVRAELRGLVDHADRGLAIARHAELANADRGRQARRPRAHDHHVELHALSFHRRQARSCGPGQCRIGHLLAVGLQHRPNESTEHVTWGLSRGLITVTTGNSAFRCAAGLRKACRRHRHDPSPVSRWM